MWDGVNYEKKNWSPSIMKKNPVFWGTPQQKIFTGIIFEFFGGYSPSEMIVRYEFFHWYPHEKFWGVPPYEKNWGGGGWGGRGG